MKRANPEDIIQKAVAKYLGLALPSNVVWWHTPNGIPFGRGRDMTVMAMRAGKRRKDMGAKAGVPDCVFILPDGRTAFIELKAPKKYLSKEQKEFKDRTDAIGCGYALCRSVDEVHDTLTAWGVQLRIKL